MNAETYGMVNYNAYCKSVGGKTWDGRDIPAWADLTDTIRNAWIASALKVRETVMYYVDNDGFNTDDVGYGE